jgi:predicted MFS family arabinose efflux permease
VPEWPLPPPQLGDLRYPTITDSLIRSRSGGLIAALTFSTLAAGLLQICLPLELRQLRASPNEIGLALAMFGFGMFAFEWLWGVLADRYGYGGPLVVSQLLYAACIVLLARADSVLFIAISYLLASGMFVAAGPVARSYLGTSLHSRLRATGLALVSAQWVIAEAIGAGAGGQLIDHFPIRSILYASAVLPAVTGLLVLWVFRGHSDTDHRTGSPGDDAARIEESRAGGGVLRVLLVTASMALLIMLGAGGELALLPLLVTSHLQLSAASAGTAMLVVGVVGGILMVPGGYAADRWGRRQAMIAGGAISAVGFIVYAIAGDFAAVIAGAAVRALGGALIWPAAIAWISESIPRRRHAFFMGIFGEFENVGVTIGPVLGGLAWSLAGIQSAFYVYAAAALIAAVIAAAMVDRRAASPVAA